MALDRGEFAFYSGNIQAVKELSGIDAIVGIDQSIRMPTVVILRFSDGKLILCKSYISSNRSVHRLQDIQSCFQRLFKTLTDKKKKFVVFIEGYAYGRIVKSHQLGEVGGVVKLAAFETGMPQFSLAPTSVKKFATGKGMVKKNMMLKEVFKRWGQDFKDDNKADAYSIAKMGLSICKHVRGEEENLLSFQEISVRDASTPQLKVRKPRRNMISEDIDEDDD